MVNDAISLYMSEISGGKGLPHKEEIALGKKIAPMVALEERGGPYTVDEVETIRIGKEAVNYLTISNAQLVIKMAKPWQGRGVAYDDVIQEGNMGLMKAARKFDYRRGYKFSTYATWWIKQAASRAVSDQSRSIRIPIHMSDRIAQIYKVVNRPIQELSCQPSVADLAKAVNLPTSKVTEALAFGDLANTVSIDEERGKDDEASYHDFLADSSPPVSTGAEHADLSEAIEGVLGTLTTREETILRLRFGLGTARPHTLQEVGQKLALTRERVRQIQAEALGKLRHPRRSRRVRDFAE